MVLKKIKKFLVANGFKKDKKVSRSASKKVEVEIKPEENNEE